VPRWLSSERFSELLILLKFKGLGEVEMLLKARLYLGYDLIWMMTVYSEWGVD
jgi:hypothetical protein